jgi:hypothetical protein
MPGTYTDHALAVIERYDTQIRANRSPSWDTLAAVNDCDDGLYGAWGEVVECAEEGGKWSYEAWTKNDFQSGFWEALVNAYTGWRVGLRGQVAAEAGWRAWREQT